MKKTTIAIAMALAAAFCSLATAQASEFDGAWLGAKVGINNSHANTVDTQNSNTYGIEGGYNWNVGPYTLGALLFADNNASTGHNNNTFSYGSKSYGLDAKMGVPMGNWLPYGKLGYVNSTANGALNNFNKSLDSFNAGFGVEYKFASHLSAAVEYMAANIKNNLGNKMVNQNLTVGLNYYFDAPAAVVAPVVVAAEPVVMKQAEPVAAPAPVVVAPAPVAAPAPAPKTIFSDKAVTLEGANFATSSAKLKTGDIADLDKVVEFAAQYPNANLTVTGYTDSRGNEKANMALSANRAEAVKAYLVKKGVAASRISTSGKGSANPVADNKTKAGQAMNRRVEVDSAVRVQTVK